MRKKATRGFLIGTIAGMLFFVSIVALCFFFRSDTHDALIKWGFLDWLSATIAFTGFSAFTTGYAGFYFGCEQWEIEEKHRKAKEELLKYLKPM